MGAVESLGEASLVAPSALPEWTRAHVVAHIGFNAAALTNLVSWARTGDRHLMYTSSEQRARDIEHGAAWAASRVVDFARATAAELDGGLRSLDDRTWDAIVVTAAGRSVAASEIPWMRAREVMIHAVDLGAGVEFADLPEDLLTALIVDVADRRASLHRDPAVRLEAEEGGTWQFGDGAETTTVTGPVSALASWVTGRNSGADLRATGPLPRLVPWL